MQDRYILTIFVTTCLAAVFTAANADAFTSHSTNNHVAFDHNLTIVSDPLEKVTLKRDFANVALDRREHNKYPVVELFRNELNALWKGKIEVGSHTFEVVFSTTALYTWIAPRNPGIVSERLHSDVVKVADIEVKGLELRVEERPAALTPDMGDGVVGLSLGLPSPRSRHFFWSLTTEHDDLERVFAFYLGKHSHELHLGWNMDHAIEYHKVEATGTTAWIIGNCQVKLSGQILPADAWTVIDTGTPMVYGPPDLVKTLYERVGGVALGDSGHYKYPCKLAPRLSFRWGMMDKKKKTRDWGIDPDVFKHKTLDGGYCIGLLVGYARPQYKGKHTWILGYGFMMNKNIVFDYPNRQVGFGETFGEGSLN